MRCPIVMATQCRNIAISVNVVGQSGKIAGTLCAPPKATTLQVLVHGLSYNRGYFDVRFEPGTYSYAQAANNAGYATLAIDRLGSGASLHPLSVFATIEAQIGTLHDVVQAARHGALGLPTPRSLRWATASARSSCKGKRATTETSTRSSPPDSRVPSITATPSSNWTPASTWLPAIPDLPNPTWIRCT